MTTSTVRVIVNPRAGRGIRDEDLLAPRFVAQGLKAEFMITAAPGHAAELARIARDAGAEVIAVVGGDGTMNEVVQAYIDDEGRPVAGPALAVLPAGTGGDFRRTLGLSGARGSAERAGAATRGADTRRERDGTTGDVNDTGDMSAPSRHALTLFTASSLNIGKGGKRTSCKTAAKVHERKQQSRKKRLLVHVRQRKTCGGS